jgi:hypothetical protein
MKLKKIFNVDLSAPLDYYMGRSGSTNIFPLIQKSCYTLTEEEMYEFIIKTFNEGVKRGQGDESANIKNYINNLFKD